MQAFIIKRKRPSVNIVTGRVSRISSGLTVAFSNANKTATQIAVRLSCTCTPLNRDSTISTDTAEIRIRAIITFMKGRKVNIHSLGLKILTGKLIFSYFCYMLFWLEKRRKLIVFYFLVSIKLESFMKKFLISRFYCILAAGMQFKMPLFSYFW